MPGLRKNIVLVLIILISINKMFAQEYYPKREFRGAWIATVGNIDWPSSRTASSYEQIADLKNQIEKLHEAGINVVIFQVRSECDAFYKSSIEPWSYWLTGKQGKAPEPFYDPLAVAVQEAHSHGMEIHAWFNPYRALRTSNTYKADNRHVTKKHPEWILTFGKYKMLNPGIPAVKDYIVSVVAEVVKNYDLDGVHFDDYFYPSNPKINKQDKSAFYTYGRNFNNVDDWRRYNISSLIAQVYDTIKAIKPYVKFGISPFGIVQNHYAGTRGMDSYSIIYSDPLTWIKNKTVDYIVPQLYWEVGKPAADYAALLKWWASVNGSVQLNIGLFSSKFMDSEWKDKSEIGRQIRLNRVQQNVSGSVFFSSRTITRNLNGLADTLKNNLFRYPALVPLVTDNHSSVPNPPANLKADTYGQDIMLSWDVPEITAKGDSVVRYIVYRFNKSEQPDLNKPSSIYLITEKNYAVIKKDEFYSDSGYKFIVTSLNRLQNESDASAIITSK
jgi:uncharacterized lipoprotein YddW (UPF0748 family)